MESFNLKFQKSDVHKFGIEAKDVTEASKKAISHMDKNQLTYCEITCPNGEVQILQKTLEGYKLD
jgi:hypothetical protein